MSLKIFLSRAIEQTARGRVRYFKKGEEVEIASFVYPSQLKLLTVGSTATYDAWQFRTQDGYEFSESDVVKFKIDPTVGKLLLGVVSAAFYISLT